MVIALNSSVSPEDAPRLSRQCAALLARLRLGPATNRELAAISLKYTSRVSDCRAAGYAIDCERLDGGLTRYTLVVGEQLQLVR
jgi:hypothetical protein